MSNITCWCRYLKNHSLEFHTTGTRELYRRETEYTSRFNDDLQLYATNESPKEAHHTQELDPAQVLHRVLLAHIGYSIEDRTEQNQTITQHNITGWKSSKNKCHL